MNNYRLMDLAYIRDEENLHTDEALILACLLHTRGRGRKTKDMEDVKRIMKDKNVLSDQKNRGN